jgi:DNA repair ATPase RecN
MENTEYSAMTNSELSTAMEAVSNKYMKLTKVAMKLAREMDDVSNDYNSLKAEIDKRTRNISNNKEEV